MTQVSRVIIALWRSLQARNTLSSCSRKGANILTIMVSSRNEPNRRQQPDAIPKFVITKQMNLSLCAKLGSTFLAFLREGISQREKGCTRDDGQRVDERKALCLNIRDSCWDWRDWKRKRKKCLPPVLLSLFLCVCLSLLLLLAFPSSSPRRHRLLPLELFIYIVVVRHTKTDKKKKKNWEESHCCGCNACCHAFDRAVDVGGPLSTLLLPQSKTARLACPLTSASSPADWTCRTIHSDPVVGIDYADRLSTPSAWPSPSSTKVFTFYALNLPSQRQNSGK